QVCALVEEAAAEAAAAEVIQGRLLLAATVLGEPAPVGVDAAGNNRANRRRQAGDRVEHALRLARPPPGHGAQQPDRIRMARVSEERFGGTFLDHPAGVEDANP